MIWYIAILCLLLGVIYIEQRKHVKVGNVGEKIVRDKLNMLDDRFVVLHNVKYKHCQIDHMVICHDKKVIFVIETKMWCDVVNGNRNDKMWKVYKNGQVEYYNNPIRQNEYHCRIVRKKYIGYSVRSIVVFVRCKDIPLYRCVVSEDKLVEYIMKIYNKVSNRGIIDI